MNSKLRKRTIIGVALILGAAVLGLAALNSPEVAAQRGTDLSSLTGQTATEETTEQFVGSAMPSLARMISALVLVIACIYGGIYLLKRFTTRSSGRGSARSLEVLETAGIAPKKTVSLVRVGDKAVLVGVTDNGISLLCELTPEQTSEIIAAQESVAEQDHFQKALNTATGKIRAFSLKRKEAALES